MTTAEVSSKAMIRFVLVRVELKDEWYSTIVQQKDQAKREEEVEVFAALSRKF